MHKGTRIRSDHSFEGLSTAWGTEPRGGRHIQGTAGSGGRFLPPTTLARSNVSREIMKQTRTVQVCRNCSIGDPPVWWWRRAPRGPRSAARDRDRPPALLATQASMYSCASSSSSRENISPERMAMGAAAAAAAAAALVGWAPGESALQAGRRARSRKRRGASQRACSGGHPAQWLQLGQASSRAGGRAGERPGST